MEITCGGTISKAMEIEVSVTNKSNKHKYLFY